MIGKQPGDLVKAAERIVDAIVEGKSQGIEVWGKHPLGRLVLGKDCLKRTRDKVGGRGEELEMTKGIAESIEVDGQL